MKRRFFNNADPEDKVRLSASLIEKAKRLSELRNQLETTLKEWNDRIRKSIPENLDIDVKLICLSKPDNKAVLTWTHKNGVWYNHEEPTTYENKRDVVALLPDLEQALADKLTKLVEELERDGALSVVDENEEGNLSESDSNGQLNTPSMHA